MEEKDEILNKHMTLKKEEMAIELKDLNQLIQKCEKKIEKETS